MIRQPTSLAAQYSWWRAYLNGDEPPRHEGDPHCGWYKYRAVKNGPFIPVRIWLDQVLDMETGELAADERMRCEALGYSRDPVALWTYLRPITRQNYEELCRMHRDIDQMAATHAPINIQEITHKTHTNTWSHV